MSSIFQCGLPPLADLGLASRDEFVRQHGDALIQFWAPEFEVLLAGGEIRSWTALGEGFDGELDEAAFLIASKLVKRLGTVPTLKFCAPWTRVDLWWDWLIGSQARSIEVKRLRLPTGRAEDEATTATDTVWQDAEPDPSHHQERETQSLELIPTWSDMLEKMVAGTGAPALEAYWLWATLKARRAVIQFARRLLQGQGTELGDDLRLMDDKQKLIDATESPGASNAARRRRSSGGAVACFRFDLEALRQVHLRGDRSSAREHFPLIRGDHDADLRNAIDAFLEPANSNWPYRPVRDPQQAGPFEAVITLLGVVSGDGKKPLEKLWVQVLRQGINKEASRLLPRHLEEQVRIRWDKLAGTARAGD